MPRVTGRALDVETTSRDFRDPDTGVTETRVSTTVFVLEGREVVPVRLAQDFAEKHGLPRKDDVVDLAVGVRAWTGRGSGAQFTITAFRPYVEAEHLSLVAAG